MAVFKCEYDRINSEWRLVTDNQVNSSEYWGNEREAKIYNRFEPNGNFYYIAAGSYREADEIIKGQQRMMNAVRLSKEEEQTYLIVEAQLGSIALVRDIRRELYADIVATEHDYYYNTAPNSATPQVAQDYQKALFTEIYYLNEFATPERTEQFLAASSQNSLGQMEQPASYEHLAEAASAAWREDNYQRQQLIANEKVRVQYPLQTIEENEYERDR
jgi:hypothetical protein